MRRSLEGRVAWAAGTWWRLTCPAAAVVSSCSCLVSAPPSAHCALTKCCPPWAQLDQFKSTRWMGSSRLDEISRLWMRSNWVWMRSSHGFNPSIFRHSGIWGAVDEAVMKNVHKNPKNPHWTLQDEREPKSKVIQLTGLISYYQCFGSRLVWIPIKSGFGLATRPRFLWRKKMGKKLYFLLKPLNRTSSLKRTLSILRHLQNKKLDLYFFFFWGGGDHPKQWLLEIK
jgi:hypothetical protein